MTTKLKWRLADRPTPSEISLLVEKDLLTKDEAREILFSLETDEDRDKKSLESEIKFLRELVERLSSNSTKIVEQIRYIQAPYIQYPWWQGYHFYCSNVTNLTAGSGTSYTGGTSTLSGAGTTAMYAVGTAPSFSSIKTF